MTAARDALRPPRGGGANANGLWPDFTMAFQPIIDMNRRAVFAYEALARGRGGEAAASLFAGITTEQRYAFDQACRMKAIAMARKLDLGARLNVNFLPNALHEAETCIRTTLRAARRHGLPLDQLVFELTEGERVTDVSHVAAVIRECRAQGVRVAIDDFGSGYSGLNLLADLQPDLVKLDLGLCRGVHVSRARRAIVHGVVAVCRDLDIEVVAEGVESEPELDVLLGLGVRYFQGFLFARPALEQLPSVLWPE